MNLARFSLVVCLILLCQCASVFLQAADDVRWDRLRPMFRPGEQVLVRSAGASKGAPTNEGPHEIAELLGRYTFRLRDGRCLGAHRLRTCKGSSEATVVPEPLLFQGRLHTATWTASPTKTPPDHTQEGDMWCSVYIIRLVRCCPSLYVSPNG